MYPSTRARVMLTWCYFTSPAKMPHVTIVQWFNSEPQGTFHLSALCRKPPSQNSTFTGTVCPRGTAGKKCAPRSTKDLIWIQQTKCTLLPFPVILAFTNLYKLNSKIKGTNYNRFEVKFLIAGQQTGQSQNKHSHIPDLKWVTGCFSSCPRHACLSAGLHGSTSLLYQYPSSTQAMVLICLHTHTA